MVIAEVMSKPKVKVSVSDLESSSAEELIESDNEEVEDVAASDADAESAGSADSGTEDEEALMTNEGWADSVAKILGSSKPKNKKTLVLSRAKKFSEVAKPVATDKPSFEVIGDGKEEKPDVKPLVKSEESEPPEKKKKTDKPSLRVKPNILEKDRERLLSKIATKGVVQLFNAVRNQQKSIEKQVERSDLTEGKKEKILKKFDKRTFLDTLMGQSKSVLVDDDAKKLKNEVKDERAPKWSALRDDFMTGAKLKDWDKESIDDE